MHPTNPKADLIVSKAVNIGGSHAGSSIEEYQDGSRYRIRRRNRKACPPPGTSRLMPKWKKRRQGRRRQCPCSPSSPRTPISPASVARCSAACLDSMLRVRARRPDRSPERRSPEFIPLAPSPGQGQAFPNGAKREEEITGDGRSALGGLAGPVFDSSDPGRRPGIQSSAFKSRVADSIGCSSDISIWLTPIAPMFLASEKTLPRPSTDPTKLL